MGGHGHGIPEVPDWKIYKTDGIPQMQKVAKILAKHGLKDPWARNEVWRFHPRIGTPLWRFCDFFFRGFLRVGFPAFVLTVVMKDYVFKDDKDDEHKGHH